MDKNQFIVDLGDLTLSDEQRIKLNAAIHKAVAGVLADISIGGKLVYIPIHDLSKMEQKDLFGENGGLINGIVVRDFKTTDFKDILKLKMITKGGT